MSKEIVPTAQGELLIYPTGSKVGVNTWKGSHVVKKDVGTAKNYLDAKEIDKKATKTPVAARKVRSKKQ